MERRNNNESPARSELETWAATLIQQVKSLRFGFVQIVVHDSRVVQIERTEKIRLDKPAIRPEYLEA